MQDIIVKTLNALGWYVYFRVKEDGQQLGGYYRNINGNGLPVMHVPALFT